MALLLNPLVWAAPAVRAATRPFLATGHHDSKSAVMLRTNAALTQSFSSQCGVYGAPQWYVLRCEQKEKCGLSSPKFVW